MNEKRAKELRRKAREFMLRYVTEVVLPEGSLTGEEECDTIIGVLPKALHIRQQGVLKCAVATQRWWYRQVKKCPERGYEEWVSMIRGGRE